MLNKKMILLKKNKYRKLFFSRAVCHLSFKITVAFKILYNSQNKPRGSYFSKALFEGLIF